MPDDLDIMIRGAMKVLDEQTPSGYFDAAPNQILSRLEDGSMQQGMTSSRGKADVDALMGPPVVPEDADTNPTPKVEASGVAPLPKAPVVAAAPIEAAAKSAPAEREEDSGLHDIRNLAQSTKQRLSSRRITMNPPNSDNDALASSSGSFANIALPQPAKMVSLPDLEDLPSKQEVIAAQKAAAKARKNKPTAQPDLKQDVLAPQATANAALAAMSAAPVDVEAAAPPVRQAFTLPSMERKKSKGPLFAVLGLGVAAAAGGFLMMGNKNEAKSTAASNADTAPAQVAVATAGSAAAAEPAPAPPPAPVEEAKPVEVAAAVAPADDDAKSGHKKVAAKAGAKKEVEKTEVVAKADTKVEKTEPVKDIKRPDGSKGGEQQAEQSFDSLLKEAGVEDKKSEKPKLDKKSLSGDDFKKGMSSINSKAQGCYKGTQGTATVKLTVGPSGAVTKVSVGGGFAGKPEAACVEAAVKAATFPAWDGGPQSFNYSYMLSD